MSTAEASPNIGSENNANLNGSQTMTAGSNDAASSSPTPTDGKTSSVSSSRDTKREASWPSVLFYIHLNILGVYGIFVLFSHTSAITFVFTSFLTLCGILGVTAGAHRLWAHKAYQASTFLRFTLMLFQTMAGQGSIYDWVRMHRLHHEQFRNADDPYYSDKDFLHAQVFANIRKLSPRQEKLLQNIDMSDLEEDGIVMFQKRFYWILYPVMFVLLPINAPLEYWGDTVQAAIFVAFSLRYLLVLNVSWLINSAHFVWGLDKNHKQSDSNMVFIVTKSYWPQYHYLLPFDYQSGEFGTYGSGGTTAFIRVCAALGMATKLQTMTTEAVKKGLTMAVDSGRPIVDCLKQAGAEDMCNLQREHYLKNERLH
ncbi:acyl-CoA Delta-9 desaturase-like [Malaya genurostris]|uniref:acyl-CoA Delta-9 desaturase-like n=1 Tax=Malaya genurostris TaxID=325434 RepID=UPI0026F37F9B|nr:acyl-CoA Delta-9 desaturase-like [Malaya genurostris]XP_058453892.1 acyl-CoA Delta-9 desaturase-like [Malaya genurostris]